MGNSNDGLDDLNKELEAAGLEPLGAVSHEESGDDSKPGSNQDDGVEVIPKEQEPDESKDQIDLDDESDESASDDDKEDEDEEEEEEGEDEEGEEESDDENDDDAARNGSSRKNIHIPYRQYKDETDDLKEQRDYWKNLANKSEKKPDTEKKDDPMELAIGKLSTELKLNPQQSKIFLETVLDLASKRAIPPDLMDRLGKLEDREKKLDIREKAEAEATYFANEWQSFAPILQKEFPNATPKQLEEARQAMDIISHSPKFAKIPDLEYIFRKTKDDFEGILFSPRKKGLEQGRRGVDEGEKREFKAPEIGEETPESMAKLEESLYGDEGSDLTFFDEDGRKMR